MTTFQVEDPGNLGRFLPLLHVGIPQWYFSSECSVNGIRPVGLDEIAGLLSHSIERGDLLLVGFYQEGEPVGYDIVRLEDGYVEGLQVYADPSARGGLFSKYSEWMTDSFGEMRFTSTMPFWLSKAPEMGFEKIGEYVQADGVPAITWRKR